MTSTYAALLHRDFEPSPRSDVERLMAVMGSSSRDTSRHDGSRQTRPGVDRLGIDSRAVSTITHLENLDKLAKKRVATFGHDWLRPIGVAKTMAQQADEERELQDSFEVRRACSVLNGEGC